MPDVRRTVIATFDDKDTALAERQRYARMLVEQGLTKQFGVSVAPIRGAFAVWLHEYETDT